MHSLNKLKQAALKKISQDGYYDETEYEETTKEEYILQANELLEYLTLVEKAKEYIHKKVLPKEQVAELIEIANRIGILKATYEIQSNTSTFRGYFDQYKKYSEDIFATINFDRENEEEINDKINEAMEANPFQFMPNKAKVVLSIDNYITEYLLSTFYELFFDERGFKFLKEEMEEEIPYIDFPAESSKEIKEILLKQEEATYSFLEKSNNSSVYCLLNTYEILSKTYLENGKDGLQRLINLENYFSDSLEGSSAIIEIFGGKKSFKQIDNEMLTGNMIPREKEYANNVIIELTGENNPLSSFDEEEQNMIIFNSFFYDYPEFVLSDFNGIDSKPKFADLSGLKEEIEKRKKTESVKKIIKKYIKEQRDNRNMGTEGDNIGNWQR